MKKSNTKTAAAPTNRVEAPAWRVAGGRKGKPSKAAAAPTVAIGPRWRHARLVKGMFIKDLVERLGVSISLISEYENDKRLPPLTVLLALVNELEANIGALFDSDWSGSGYNARAGAWPRITAAGEGESARVTLELVAPKGQRHLLQGNVHIFASGGSSKGPLRHEGDEVGFVLEGRLELSVASSCRPRWATSSPGSS